jgi:peptidoglycan/LPS O-acetylase OafA/YrhL
MTGVIDAVDAPRSPLAGMSSGASGTDIARDAPSAEADPPDGGDHPPPRSRSLGHIPALDGLRGVAWMMVFVDHTRLLPDLQFGEVAMYVFLALSGFLITVQVAGEAGRDGRVRIRRFFGRRVRRLLPALAFMVAVWVVVVVLFPHATWTTTTPGGGSPGPVDLTVAAKGAAGALTYASNWLDILGLYGGRFPLGHLWFLATQEQFYLLWVPLLALLIIKARRLVVPAALGLAALSVVEALVMMQHGTNWLRIYAGTDTRAASILVGSALAIGWSSGRLDWLGHRLGGAVVRAASLVALGWTLVAFSTDHGSTIDGLAWVVATAAGAALVVSLVVTRRGIMRRVLGQPVLRYLGSRSYGLYLWHYVWLTWLAGLGGIGILAALLASLVSAEVSWQLVEQRLSGRPRRPARPTPSPPPTGAIGPGDGDGRRVPLGSPAPADAPT